jgi:hypothetical protein
MARIIQFRRDAAANWTSNNPILAQGELGLETDTNFFKLGDGTTSWTSLAYKDKIESIYDVDITSISDNQILAYDSSTTKWKNESAATLLTDSMPVSMPSSGVAFRKSDGTTSILSETGGVATLDNVALGSSVTGIGGTATQYFELSLTNDAAGNLTELTKFTAGPTDTVTIDETKEYYLGTSMDFQIINNDLVMVI